MGKVHGSLARAGKVKGQTPKVEKQEKPKQPKGRAKKRLLYNRYVLYANERCHLIPFSSRFVNVTLGPSGKRRANAQSVSDNIFSFGAPLILFT